MGYDGDNWDNVHMVDRIVDVVFFDVFYDSRKKAGCAKNE